MVLNVGIELTEIGITCFDGKAGAQKNCPKGFNFHSDNAMDAINHRACKVCYVTNEEGWDCGWKVEKRDVEPKSSVHPTWRTLNLKL
jgi:hypothetical protein